MTDTHWLDEQYPLDHTITWREHFERKEDADYEKHGPQHD